MANEKHDLRIRYIFGASGSELANGKIPVSIEGQDTLGALVGIGVDSIAGEDTELDLTRYIQKYSR